MKWTPWVLCLVLLLLFIGREWAHRQRVDELNKCHMAELAHYYWTAISMIQEKIDERERCAKELARFIVARDSAIEYELDNWLTRVGIDSL